MIINKVNALKKMALSTKDQDEIRNLKAIIKKMEEGRKQDDGSIKVPERNKKVVQFRGRKKK